MTVAVSSATSDNWSSKKWNTLLRSYEAAVTEKVTLLETRPTPWQCAKTFWWNSRSEAARKSSKIHLLLLTRKSPPPTGYIAYFLFESFFPFVLYFAALSQVSVGADFRGHKDSFYSSHLKNNFLCHLFGFLFLGRRFPPQPGLDCPSLLQHSHSVAYKCFKKRSRLLLDPKPLQSLAELKDVHSKNVTNTFHVISLTKQCWMDVWGCEFVWICAIQFNSKSHTLFVYYTPHEATRSLVVTFRSAAKWYDDLGNLCRFMSFMFTTVCFSCGGSPRMWIHFPYGRYRGCLAARRWDDDSWLHIHVISTFILGGPPVLPTACMCCSRAPHWTFCRGRKRHYSTPELSQGFKLTPL